MMTPNAAATEIRTEFLSLKLSDQSDMQIFVARPAVQDNLGKKPAILLLQEAFGVNHHIQKLAIRFAQEGYVVAAPELFHRTAPKGFVGDYEDFATVAPHYQAVTPETLTVDLQGTYDWLNKDSQVNPKAIAAIGYCMGGRAAFFANSFLPLQAASSFYGGGIAPTFLSLAEKQNAPLLMVWGGQDSHIGTEGPRQIHDALAAAKKDFIDVTYSFAGHGFFCDERKAYNAEASRQAWELTKVFFREHLKN